jgi:cardiolipin synthase (CMP-forming)
VPGPPDPDPAAAGPAGPGGEAAKEAVTGPAGPGGEAAKEAVTGPAGPGGEAAKETAPGDDRILTIPNVLSLGRLCCVPLFLWLLFGRDNRVAAAILLGVLGATDWVDGFIARRYDQVSTVGKVLDPTADRILLAVGIFAILVDGAVPAWVAWLAIFREVAVSAGVLALAALGARRIDVQWVGKAGTFLLMVAFPLFLVSHADDLSWADAARAVAWPCALVGLAFGYYSAIRYIPLGREALKAGRASRRPRARRVGSAG